jgi:hypothetical protein
MRLLELFSGTKSVSKVARDLGWESLSLDLCPRHSPDLCMDIMDFDEALYPKDYFDFIWASCPCEAYSSARTVAKIPRDEAMRISDKLVTKTLQVISWFGCPFCIENPATSRLWTRDVAAGLQCITTSYCCHGTLYRKNTNIASNFLKNLPTCPGFGLCHAMVGRRHKEHAQKGGGGLEPKYKSRDELHRIPEPLVREILIQLNDSRRASTD